MDRFDLPCLGTAECDVLVPHRRLQIDEFRLTSDADLRSIGSGFGASNCRRSHRRPRPNGENYRRYWRLFWHWRRDRPRLPFRRRKRCCASARYDKGNLADMPDVRLDIMNLLDLGSIDAFAEQFLRDNEKRHILVNNVGIMAPPLERDTRGYESQFAANHFGHFQLTCRLWPALVAAEGARVVALSSYGHRRLGSIFTIPISSAVSTTLGSLMGSRKRPMPCSP